MVPKICSVEECESPSRARGYCNPHHHRYVRYGDPLGKPVRLSAEARFWSRVRKTGACWEWSAGKISTGYGMFHPVKGSGTLAHRYSYELVNGPIPEGLHIDHLCRNTVCVNPSHLEAVEPIENARRGLSHRLLNGMDDSCINGHKYTPENTYVNPNKKNDVRCRRCARNRDLLRRRAA